MIISEFGKLGLSSCPFGAL